MHAFQLADRYSTRLILKMPLVIIEAVTDDIPKRDVAAKHVEALICAHFATLLMHFSLSLVILKRNIATSPILRAAAEDMLTQRAGRMVEDYKIDEIYFDAMGPFHSIKRWPHWAQADMRQYVVVAAPAFATAQRQYHWLTHTYRSALAQMPAV